MARRKPAYTTEAMSRRRHEAEMDAVRQTSITEKKKALMPETNLVCLKERCWLYGKQCKPRKERCEANFKKN